MSENDRCALKRASVLPNRVWDFAASVRCLPAGQPPLVRRSRYPPPPRVRGTAAGRIQTRLDLVKKARVARKRETPLSGPNVLTRDTRTERKTRDAQTSSFRAPSEPEGKRISRGHRMRLRGGEQYPQNLRQIMTGDRYQSRGASDRIVPVVARNYAQRLASSQGCNRGHCFPLEWSKDVKNALHFLIAV
jgi:hypothetical protein